MELKEKDRQAVERIQRGLKCSWEEAMEVWKDDKAIDKGENLFELTDEQKKVAKKYTIAPHKKKNSGPTVYNFKTDKPKKKDAEKEEIIAEIARFLQENASIAFENVEIANPTKLITFKIGENVFKLDLIRQNKNKK